MTEDFLPGPEAASRLAAELMPVAIAVGGGGAASLAAILAGEGMMADVVGAPTGEAGAFDLGILLAAPSAAGAAATQDLVAAMSHASERLLFIPRGGERTPTLLELTAWFELFAELGYQPVVDFDAGFLAQGAFLVDRSATAAESELGGFAERLSLGGALADSTQRVANLEAELAGGERALRATIAARDTEIERLRIEARAAASRLAGLLHRAEGAEAQAAQARAELAAEREGWEALRLWVRAKVAGDQAQPAQRRGFLSRLFGKETPGADEALLRASTLFDPAWYIASNPSLAEHATDPIRHYLETGAQSGADPGPWFDAAAYRAEHRDLPGDANPLLHALKKAR